MSIYTDYWAEVISDTCQEMDMPITQEQLEKLAESLHYAHQSYGMWFYSPPSSDRIADVDREWKAKYERLEKEMEAYRKNAETAVKIALRQHDDSDVSIRENGEVLRHGGRTERIQ